MADGAEFAWVEQTRTLDAHDPAVKAMDDNPGWHLLGVGIGSGGQTTLTYGWPWPAPDTAHVLTAARLAQAEAFLDAWCTAAEDGEALGPLREQTLGWLG